MEHVPTLSDMSLEQLHQREGEIDQQIIALEGNINQIPARNEESASGDDNAVESEMSQQDLGTTGFEIDRLRDEKKEIQAELARRTQEAA
jgi:hypothetical protein